MEKSKVTRYIADKKEDIRASQVLPRINSFTFAERMINVVMGPRRAGKTYFLYDIILNKLKLKDEDFIFIDFEDAIVDDTNINTLLDIVNIHEELYGKKPKYLFFDEIQVIKHWEKAIRTLFETKKYIIFLSGSSAKLLSREIATSLRGRALSYTILPFSFKEFLEVKNYTIKEVYSSSEENKIKKYLREYLKYGGFPNVIMEKKIAGRFFKEYLDLVVFRDVIERHQIKNVFLIKFLIKSILSSFAKEFSIHNIFNILKSQNIKVSKKTLYEYTAYLEEAFFSFFLKKFSYSMKKAELSIPKVFINDVGLVNASPSSFSENMGRSMENIVFLELLRKEENIAYFKTTAKHEVDFVIKKGKKIGWIIQVCYDISDARTRKREIDALLNAGKELRCKNLLIITWDVEAEKKLAGETISFIPLWKWLLGIKK